MTTTTTPEELTPAQITISLDRWGRPVAVLPDDIAERLATSSREGASTYGYCIESRRFGPDTFETRAIRAILEAILQAHPEEQSVSQYRKHSVGDFYGWTVGASGWNDTARTWQDYDTTNHLHLPHLHLNHDGTSHFSI